IATPLESLELARRRSAAARTLAWVEPEQSRFLPERSIARPRRPAGPSLRPLVEDHPPRDLPSAAPSRLPVRTGRNLRRSTSVRPRGERRASIEPIARLRRAGGCCPPCRSIRRRRPSPQRPPDNVSVSHWPAIARQSPLPAFRW